MRRADGRAPRPRTTRPEAVGLGLLAAGLLALVLAFPLESLPLLTAAAVLAGLGHGYAFLGAQAELNAIAPEERRGEITATFATCVYLGVALPVIGVGLLALIISLFVAVAIYAAVVAGIALVAAGWHLAPIVR